MKTDFIKSIFIFFLSTQLCDAQILSGQIKDQKDQALAGVQVFFIGTNEGTQTDARGEFYLLRPSGKDSLAVSYAGFQSDTFLIPEDMTEILLILKEGIELDAITITSERRSHSFSLLNPINIESLNAEEFRKAACCSLAESFQTSNTVDLSYNNAVVGNREIQFLGLRGAYTQQLIENRPVFTGILSTFGYDFIPGTWLQQVNIQKGAASALYGAQSMTGAINVSLVKPESDPPLYCNLYGDYHGRYEANVHLSKNLTKEWSSGSYLHASRHSGFRDHNNDGFYDDSRTLRLNGMWRNTFNYQKVEGQFNIQGLRDYRTGGQNRTDNPYSSEQTIQHFNASANVGYIGFSNPNTTLGSIWDYAYSELDGRYGFYNSILGKEHHFQSQLIFSHSWREDMHSILLGPSATFNKATEDVKIKSFQNSIAYDQLAFALFADYSLKFGSTCAEGTPKVILSLSQRIEWPDSKTPYWFPRMNARYNFLDAWTLRASAGRGYRFYRLYSDQINLLSTNMIWTTESLPHIELSWNYGLNIVGKPVLLGKELELNFDAYLTKFIEQIVVDLEEGINSNTPQIQLYGLEGNSRSLVLGMTITLPLEYGLSVKFGTRYQNNKLQYRSGFKDQWMVPRWRGLGSLDWESNNKKWSINFTVNAIGQMRFSDKTVYPHALVHDHTGYSKPYVMIQSQINYIHKMWEFYLGCENIGNYTQHSAIMDYQNPDKDYFNPTEVYAPINGIKPYLGVKYRLIR